jgi:CheY-like chemotaxis protein
VEKRILVAEDDPKSGKMLKELLDGEGYSVTLAVNGKEALDVFQKNPFPVVITDLEMPVMDGRELIDRLNESTVHPVIFVETVHAEPDVIIDLMKIGVHDYLIKPIDLVDLVIKVHRSFEIAELQRMKAIVEREKVLRLEQQLEWYRFESRLTSKEIKSQTGQALFHSMHTSFSQGIGFGTILSIGMIMASGAKKEGSNYIVDGQIFDYFQDNLRMIEKIIDTFKEIDILNSNAIDFEETNYPRFHAMVRETVQEMEPMAKFKEHHIMLSDMKQGHDDRAYSINTGYFKKVLQELFFNAFKFSQPKTGVVVMTGIENGLLNLTIINTPIKDQEGRIGIPMEYENIVFEPFYRLTKTSQDKYRTLDFGLGLTLVETIIKKHNGTVKIGNIRDYSTLSEGSETRVSVTVNLPEKK